MMENIFEQKELIFEHIFYEIEMYLYTNFLLCNPEINQWTRNMAWASNLTHMRNLIYFFSDNPTHNTDITYKTVLDHIDTLGIDKKSIENLVKIINKSISHLTLDRISNDYVTDTTIEIKKVTPILFIKIQNFVDAIPTDVNDKYRNELKNSTIIELLKTLRELISSTAYSTT